MRRAPDACAASTWLSRAARSGAKSVVVPRDRRRDQCAVAVVGGGTLLADHVAGQVVDLAEHLVGRVDIVVRVQDDLERHIGAVAGRVVGIVLDRAQILHGVGQPPQPLVGVADDARG